MSWAFSVHDVVDPDKYPIDAKTWIEAAVWVQAGQGKDAHAPAAVRFTGGDNLAVRLGGDGIGIGRKRKGYVGDARTIKTGIEVAVSGKTGYGKVNCAAR